MINISCGVERCWHKSDHFESDTCLTIDQDTLIYPLEVENKVLGARANKWNTRVALKLEDAAIPICVLVSRQLC